MKIVGIEIAGSDLRWICVVGNQRAGAIEHLAQNTLRFPTSHATPAENFRELKQLVFENLRNLSVDGVAIIKADHNSSVERAKCELMVQLACLDLNVPCSLVAIATVNAATNRRIAGATGADFNAAFNSGAAISPGYLERAAHCAWTSLR